MIEIHTQIKCQSCEKFFWAVYVNSAALSKHIKRSEKCPFCGQSNSYEYEFDAFFPCLPKFWQFWKKRKHYIEDHFSKNGFRDSCNKIFPRKCVCDEIIILNQRRLK